MITPGKTAEASPRETEEGLPRVADQPLQAPASLPDMEAERAYWDQHDTGNMTGFQPVDDRGSPTEGLTHVLSVRLDRETFHALSRLARHVGVGPSTLLRMWALERLRVESAQ